VSHSRDAPRTLPVTPGAELSAFQRLVVHERCEALGLRHQSTGEDAARAVRCFKTASPATTCAEEAAASDDAEPAEPNEPTEQPCVPSQSNYHHPIPPGAADDASAGNARSAAPATSPSGPLPSPSPVACDVAGDTTAADETTQSSSLP